MFQIIVSCCVNNRILEHVESVSRRNPLILLDLESSKYTIFHFFDPRIDCRLVCALVCVGGVNICTYLLASLEVNAVIELCVLRIQTPHYSFSQNTFGGFLTRQIGVKSWRGVAYFEE